MARSAPYQPLLLRLLHGFNALLVLVALPTGFWLYNSYDGRFGRLDLPKVGKDMIDIHGTVGFTLLFSLIGLVLYSFYSGRKRLIQGGSLGKIATPQWWFALHRVVNTGFLVALGLAVLSGKNMSEEWLPEGELGSPWYAMHLGAWGLIASFLILHFLMLIKVGGVPLILSMLDPRFRPNDTPAQWWQTLRRRLP